MSSQIHGTDLVDVRNRLMYVVFDAICCRVSRPSIRICTISDEIPGSTTNEDTAARIDRTSSYALAPSLVRNGDWCHSGQLLS